MPILQTRKMKPASPVSYSWSASGGLSSVFMTSLPSVRRLRSIVRRRIPLSLLPPPPPCLPRISHGGKLTHYLTTHAGFPKKHGQIVTCFSVKRGRDLYLYISLKLACDASRTSRKSKATGLTVVLTVSNMALDGGVALCGATVPPSITQTPHD